MPKYTPRSPRPSGVTEDQWEGLCSPENYYCDGEITPAQAAQRFDQNVKLLLQRNAQRAAAAQSSPQARVSSAPVHYGTVTTRSRTGSQRVPGYPMRWKRAMVKPCPYCDAPINRPCQTRQGKVTEPHQARLQGRTYRR